MTAGVRRLDRDVLSHEGATDVIVFMGTNDIKYGAPAAKIIAGMQDIIARVRARGLRIFGGTILPRQSSDRTPAKERVRRQVNQWIRGEAAFDRVIDFDEVIRAPADPGAIAALANCDNVHPNPLGYYQMGRAVDLAMIAQ